LNNKDKNDDKEEEERSHHNSFSAHVHHRGQTHSNNNDRNSVHNTSSITTFRPSVDLDNLLVTTLRPPDPPVTTAFLQEPSPRTTPPPPETTPATASLVTVPLPNLEDEANNAITGSRGGGSGRRRGKKNFRRIGVNARFSANFRPTPKSFNSGSNFEEDSSVGSIAKDVTTLRPQSVTEIVKVFLSDQKLFEQEFDYYDYYDDKKRRI